MAGRTCCRSRSITIPGSWKSSTPPIRAYGAKRSRPEPSPHPLSFGTDAAHFAHRLGMEGVVYGPGGRYNTMPDERVDIPDYLDAVRIYLLAILETCETVDKTREL